MKAWKRIGILFGFIGIVGILWIVMSGQHQAREVMLKDGSMVRFVGSIQGGLPFSTEQPWQRFLRQRLPPAFVRWLPPMRMMTCGETNALSLYFIRANMTATGRGRFWGRIQAVEEGGYEYPNSSGSCSASMPDGMQLLSAGLRSFPRRQEAFPVLVFDRDDQLIAEFRVENPMRKTFPTWVGQPLPITNVVKGTRVVLEGFAPRENEYGQFWSPSITIESIGGAENGLRQRYHQFSDPTGNKGSSLSPKEPVWKSTIKLYRPRTSEFPEHVRGTFQLDAIPAEGQVFPRQEVVNIDGLNLKLVFFSGPGVTTVVNGVSFQAEMPDRSLANGRSTTSSSRGPEESWESTNQFRVVETEDPGPYVEFIFRVFDQDWNRIELVNAFHGYEGGNLRPPYRRRYTFPVSLDASVTALRVDCIVNRGLSFEFLVNSADLFAESN